MKENVIIKKNKKHLNDIQHDTQKLQPVNIWQFLPSVHLQIIISHLNEGNVCFKQKQNIRKMS